jgi:predicted solute-binding protein
MAMERGEVDAGLMAVADLIRLRSTFEPLVLERELERVSFGIANRDRVDSVLLFVRTPEIDSDEARSSGARLALNPADRDRLSGSTIAVTGESSTSYRLLRLLLESRHEIRPTAYERFDLSAAPPDSVDAALVIGDLALEWRHAPPAGWRQAMDLAHEWWIWQERPFVFARWAVRKELGSDHKTTLATFLQNSLHDGANCLGDHVIGLPTHLGSARDLEAYLTNFIYELGPEEDRAEETFRGLLDQHGIICTAQ